MTPEELAAIDAREQAATPGPWDVIGLPNNVSRIVAPLTEVIDLEPNGEEGCDATLFLADWDAVFIAEARTDIPAMRAEIRRLTAQRDHARAVANRIANSSYNDFPRGEEPVLAPEDDDGWRVDG